MSGSAILTDNGLLKIASASPLDQLTITQIAIGDGVNPLDPNSTTLVNEVYRDAASTPIRSTTYPNTIVFELNIPPTTGGFTCREIGAFDTDGDLIAVGTLDELVKPTDGINYVARINVKLANAAQVDVFYDNQGAIDHGGLRNRDAVGAHDDIYVRTVAIEEAIAEDAPVGTRYNINGSNFTVVDILDSGSDFYLSLNASKKLKAIPPYSLVGLGILADGTDKTSEIISLLESVAGGATIVMPVGGDVLANWQEVITAMPSNVALDVSGVRTVWRSDTGGYNTKVVQGVLSNDEAIDDSINQIASGHHPALQFINTGTSGSTSGDNRIASLLFSNRFLNPAQSGVRGYQNTAIIQHGGLDDDVWGLTIRRLAPWEAAKADYFEFWKSSVTVPAGAYVRTGNKIYKTVSGGVTGSTQPVHTSGSVSDGGVVWEYISTGDTTIFTVTENGNISAGGGSNRDLLMALRPKLDEPAIVEFASTGPSQQAILKVLGTNAAGGIVTSTPVIRGTPNGTLSVTNDEGGPLLSFSGNRVDFVRELYFGSLTISNNSPTISAVGVNTIVLSNTDVTNVSTITAGNIRQEIVLVASNSNTTLVNSGTIRLEGGVDLSMSEGDVVTLRKFSYTSAWIEVSRSIK